jgi:hypothetical protein
VKLFVVSTVMAKSVRFSAVERPVRFFATREDVHESGRVRNLYMGEISVSSVSALFTLAITAWGGMHTGQ